MGGFGLVMRVSGWVSCLGRRLKCLIESTMKICERGYEIERKEQERSGNERGVGARGGGRGLFITWRGGGVAGAQSVSQSKGGGLLCSPVQCVPSQR
jgi:hypothetical protein